MERTSGAHRRCVDLLDAATDPRIKARYDADVADAARVRQKALQRRELTRTQTLLKWTRGKDLSLYKKWNSLMSGGEFNKEDQGFAQSCYSKALSMKKLEEAGLGRADVSAEDSDLELWRWSLGL